MKLTTLLPVAIIPLLVACGSGPTNSNPDEETLAAYANKCAVLAGVERPDLIFMPNQAMHDGHTVTYVPGGSADYETFAECAWVDGDVEFVQVME